MQGATRMTKLRVAACASALVAAFTAGVLSGRGCGVPPPGGAIEGEQAVKAAIWTCSMHPQIRQPGPGKCPICAMDLVPVGEEEDAGAADVELHMSPAARKLAEVRLAPAERRPVEVAIRMTGKIGLDETRVAYIAPRVPGRIDRLYVNFVGVPVKKGDHLADLYSPELLSAQQELIQAARSVAGLPAGGSVGAAQARETLESAREKLRLWQLTADQIAEVERSGTPRDHVTFYSPLAGVISACSGSRCGTCSRSTRST